jgi:uncharacterized protein
MDAMPRLSALHIYPLKSAHRVSLPSARVEPWGLAGDRRWMLVSVTGRFVTQREHPALALVHIEPQGGGALLITAPGADPLYVEPPNAARGDRLADVQVWGTRFQAAEAVKEAHAWFSGLLDDDLRLVHLDDPHRRPANPAYAPGRTVSLADGLPLLLTTTASLAALNAWIAADHPDDPDPAGALPMARFRPNLVVEGTEPWAEDGWRRILVGEVAFQVVKPSPRCVITTTDQETGRRHGPEPLRTLGRHRRLGNGLMFGQNLVPEYPADRPAGAPGETLGTVRAGDRITVLEEGPPLLPTA